MAFVCQEIKGLFTYLQQKRNKVTECSLLRTEKATCVSKYVSKYVLTFVDTARVAETP